MRESTKEVIRRALQAAVDEDVISAMEYERAQREVEAAPTSDGYDPLEMGGYALIEFLYARAIEAGEEPPACARDWRQVEVAMADCSPEDRERFSDLQSRSHELAAECRAAARRWSDHEEFDARWAEAT